MEVGRQRVGLFYPRHYLRNLGWHSASWGFFILQPRPPSEGASAQNESDLTNTKKTRTKACMVYVDVLWHHILWTRLGTSWGCRGGSPRTFISKITKHKEWGMSGYTPAPRSLIKRTVCPAEARYTICLLSRTTGQRRRIGTFLIKAFQKYLNGNLEGLRKSKVDELQPERFPR